MADEFIWPPPEWDEAGPTDAEILSLLTPPEPVVSDEDEIRAILGAQPLAVDDGLSLSPDESAGVEVRFPWESPAPASTPVVETPAAAGPQATTVGEVSLPVRTGAFAGPFASEFGRAPGMDLPLEQWGDTRPPLAPTLPEQAPELPPGEEAALLEREQDPLDVATRFAEEDVAREQQVADRAESLARDNVEQLRRNQARYEQAAEAAKQQSLALAAEAKAHGEQGVDRERWWADRSTGQKIGGFLAAGIQGWLNPTGPNSVVDLIQKQIAQDLELQEAELAHKGRSLDRRGNLLQESYNRIGDEHQARETARLAGLAAADAELAAWSQRLDPRGQAIRRVYAARQGIRAEMAAAERALEETTWKRNAELVKMQTDQDAIAQRERASRRSAAAARRGQDIDMLRMGEERAARQQAADAAKSDKKRTKIEQQGVAGVLPPEMERAGGIFVAPTVEDAREIRKTKGAIDTTVGLYDRLIWAVDKYGWSSDLLESPEWQEMQADKSALVLSMKETAKLGALSGSDIEIVEKAIGTDDPTQVIDPTPGLKRGRKNAIEAFDKNMKTHAGYKEAWGDQVYEPPLPTDVAREQQDAAQKAEDARFVQRFGSTRAELKEGYQDYLQARGEEADLGIPSQVLTEEQWVEQQEVGATEQRESVAKERRAKLLSGTAHGRAKERVK